MFTGLLNESVLTNLLGECNPKEIWKDIGIEELLHLCNGIELLDFTSK